MNRNSQFSIFNSQFFAFVKKEFYHILRDKRTMFILLGMPIVQIIIFGFALTNEVKNSKIAVLDNSKDAATASSDIGNSMPAGILILKKTFIPIKRLRSLSGRER